jgi:hypothetical protein
VLHYGGVLRRPENFLNDADRWMAYPVGMSRIIRFHQTGGPEVLQIDEVEVAAPKRGEVRISVKALGLKPRRGNVSGRAIS